MTEFNPERLSDGELWIEFESLFPQGFGGGDVMRELAPEGWESSPLVAINHPTPSQLHEELVRMHRNIAALRRTDSSPVLEPTLEEMERDHQPSSVEPDRELRELVGQCLWDVFSDGHEVTHADGRILVRIFSRERRVPR